MASTNEDVVVLATTSLDQDKRLLVLRHLPDRGTVEIGWWVRESDGIVPAPKVLELAAEMVEIDAVLCLCEKLLADAGCASADEGEVLAETPPDADGAWIVALRSGAGVTLVRRPEGGELVLPSRAALGLLVGIFPAARQKLAEFGFGLVQQGAPTLAAAKGRA